MKYYIVFRKLEDGVESDDIFEVNDVLYDIMHDTLKDVIKDRPMPGEEEMDDCPLCGKKTEQIVECPECGAQGCVERCHPGGAGCLCPTCEEKGMD